MELQWGVKKSFLDYIRSMPDGAVTALDPAAVLDSTCVFPGEVRDQSRLTFRGGVRFTGHHGLLDLTLKGLSLDRSEAGWHLSIADPYAAGQRVALAVVDSLTLPIANDSAADRTARGRGAGVRLTAEGADLFFGPYSEGTALDDLVLVVPGADGLV